MRGLDDVADVIVVKTLGAKLERAGRRPRGRRRPSPAEPGDEAEPVKVTRVTVIRGLPLDDTAAAGEWLTGCGDAEFAAGEVAEALKILNRAIHAHRLAAADPYVGDLSLDRARRVRLGYGGGDELVEGRWRDAYSVPRQVPRRGRLRMLAPDEPLALMLGGKRATYPSEDLLLRARLDLDQGRTREAALQARAAHEALEAELRGEDAAEQTRTAMEAHREPLSGFATAALDQDLDETQLDLLEQIVVEMERVARRRRHLGGEER